MPASVSAPMHPSSRPWNIIAGTLIGMFIIGRERFRIDRHIERRAERGAVVTEGRFERARGAEGLLERFEVFGRPFPSRRPVGP